jgi:predicted transcriptional regulator
LKIIFHKEYGARMVPMHGIEKIGRMRRQMGLTQKKLASLAGVSQSLIAKIESGRIDPAYSKVMSIMEALESEGKKGKKACGDVMTRNIVSVTPSDALMKAVSLMRQKDISQLPVIEAGKCVGSLSDGMVVDLVAGHRDLSHLHVREVMKDSYPVLPANSPADVAADLLHHYRAVLVEKGGNLAGIITRADLLKAI